MIEKINLKLARFDKDEDRKKAIEELRSGIGQPFWKFILNVLDENIELVKEELLENEDLSKEENNLNKRYIKVMESLKELPKRQMNFLININDEEEEENPDPYHQETEQ